MTGVGKRPAALDPLSFLRLWHATLAHITARCLFDTLDFLLVVSNKPVITPEAKRAFATEHCDICDAYKQRKVKPTAEHPTVAIDVEHPEANPEATARGARQAKTVSPTRALRGLYRIIFDVFGPVAVPSAQFNFTYVLGYSDEATGMRWVFGSKSHKRQRTSSPRHRCCVPLSASYYPTSTSTSCAPTALPRTAQRLGATTLPSL